MVEQLLVTPSQMDEILDLSQEAFGGTIAYSSTGTRAYFVTIGPEFAKKLLETYSVDYRKLRPNHAEDLAMDMRNEKWQLDGSPIRLTSQGHLLDGQHRATALIMSNTRQEFLIVDCLSESTYDTVDTNALSRSYNDILRKRGFSNVSSRTALTKLLLKWDTRTQLDTREAFKSIAELDAVHNPNQERITWAVNNAANLDRNIYVAKSIVSLAFFVLGQVSEVTIKELLSAVAIGEGLYRGTPEFALMNRLKNDRNSGRDKIRTPDESMWLITRAWKTYHQNKQRPENNQLRLENLVIPSSGVSIRDLKEMMVTE
jgi:hypothetical protein